MKKLFLAGFIGIMLVLLSGCGSDQRNGPMTAGTGGVEFNLSWENNAPSAKVMQAPPPGTDICTYYQIARINASVDDSSGRTVASDSWNCSVHGGTIPNVPAGTVRVTIEGVVAGTAVWRGQATGVVVLADQVSSAGTITMGYVGSDATAPTVADVTPAANAVKQRLNAPISVAFNKDVISSSVSTVVSLSSGTHSIAGLVSYNSTSHIATFTPSSFLTYSTAYTVTVGTGVEDLAGHQLAAPYAWSFTTNAYPNTVTGTVPLGTNVSSTSLTPDGKNLYGTNGPGNSVVLIRISDYSVVKTIPTGTNPVAAAVTPSGGHVYVANANGNSVSVIQTSDNTVRQTVSVGTRPTNLAVTPDGGRVYVSNFSSNSVSVIRTSDNTVTQTIFLGYYVSGLCISPDGASVYVLNASSAAADGADSVSIIKTADNSVTGPYAMCSPASDIITTADGSHAYIACSGGPLGATGSVVVMRTADNAKMTTIPLAPYAGTGNPIITPDGSYVYVTNSADTTISIIRTSDNTTIDTLGLGLSPYGMAMSYDGSTVYVTTGVGNYLLVVQRP